MAKTRHIHKRMSQRGVTDRMLKMVSDYGISKGINVFWIVRTLMLC